MYIIKFIKTFVRHNGPFVVLLILCLSFFSITKFTKDYEYKITQYSYDDIIVNDSTEYIVDFENSSITEFSFTENEYLISHNSKNKTYEYKEVNSIYVINVVLFNTSFVVLIGFIFIMIGRSFTGSIKNVFFSKKWLKDIRMTMMKCEYSSFKHVYYYHSGGFLYKKSNRELYNDELYKIISNYYDNKITLPKYRGLPENISDKMLSNLEKDL